MKTPSKPRSGESVIGTVNEIIDYAKANKIVSIQGGQLRESPNGTIIIIGPQTKQSGGISALPARYIPWKPNFFTEDDVLKCRFNLGTVNNVAATNWENAHTLPSDGAVRFVVLDVTISASGKVTGCSISVEASPPTGDSVNKDTPPGTCEILLGAVDGITSKMIVAENLNLYAQEVFRESKDSVGVGGEPFSRWWRWRVDAY